MKQILIKRNKINNKNKMNKTKNNLVHNNYEKK